MVQDSSIPVVWEASPIPWTLSEMYPPRSPGGAWAPQHPFAEHGFKVPACLLEIKLLCRSGIWQRAVCKRGWHPCSQGNFPSATSRLQFGGDFGVFWCSLGGSWSSLQLEER